MTDIVTPWAPDGAKNYLRPHSDFAWGRWGRRGRGRAAAPRGSSPSPPWRLWLVKCYNKGLWWAMNVCQISNLSSSLKLQDVLKVSVLQLTEKQKSSCHVGDLLYKVWFGQRGELSRTDHRGIVTFNNDLKDWKCNAKGILGRNWCIPLSSRLGKDRQ